MSNALELEQVTKSFGDFTAVSDISFSVPEGCIYGFLGPNGAGKTTTIRMIMNIFSPDRGSISVLGESVSDTVKDRVGYLPEDKGLYRKMKVREILIYFARLRGMQKSGAAAKADDLLESFGLKDWKEKKCETLSKGMGQKLQILISLIHGPELVILDEPFSGLDPVNFDVMRDVILNLKSEGKTVLFSTHIMPQAEQICDRILMLSKGKKVLDGPLSEVKHSGGEAIHLDFDGDGSVLNSITGVQRIRNSGKTAEVFLLPDADPQVFLKEAAEKVKIRKFDLGEPSLHELFIRAAGGESDE